MSRVAVGKDVEAVCRKCGEVWHVIVAIGDEKITKVQCKECMAYHRYRPPEGEDRVDGGPKPRSRAATTTAKAGKTSPRKTSKKKTSKKKSKASAGPIIEPDLSRPTRIYKMTESYTPGDRVEHPKFGEGVVEASPGDGKINVFFEDGRRTLAHAR